MTQDGITPLVLSVFVTLTFFFYLFYRLQRLIDHLENRY